MAQPVVFGRRAVHPAIVVALVGLPFLIALLALSSKHWIPVLDLAMTDFRVRDVGTSHTPLIGLPGRIGSDVNPGSHPGPLSFYLLAPLYRLFGQHSFTLLLGAGLIQFAAAIGFVAVVWRVAGRRVGIAATAAMVILMHSYGPSFLTQPWNPYLPLLSWSLLLVCVWGVLSGHPRLMLVIAVVASLCAQTHVPYVGISLGLALLAAVGLIVNVIREKDIDRRVDAVQWGVWSVIIAALLWVPPVVDQVLHKPGNLRVLTDYFRHPTQKAIGLGGGIKLMLRHFDLFRLLLGARFDVGNLFFGTIFFLIWVATVVAAFQMRHWLLVRLHIVVAWAVVLGMYSLGRIFGQVWYYLSLWAWGIATVAFLAAAWTIWCWLRLYQPKIAVKANRHLTLATFVIAVLATLACTIESSHVKAPEQSIGAPVARLIDPTIKAISLNQAGAQGKRGTYLVTWEDSYFLGSQGYALLDELERRGYHVGTIALRSAQVTPHRVLNPAKAATNIVLAVGHSIDDVAARPGALKITSFDPRTAAQILEYSRLHDQVIKELLAAHKDALVPLVDENLFLLGNDATVAKATATKLHRMSELGLPVAVFFVPITA